MHEVLPVLLDRLTHGPVAMARVVRTDGPTPRAVGATMLVTADGEVIGSVSGGCVESALVHTCAEVIADGAATTERFGVSDPEGFEIGLTCGGQIEVFVERVDPGRAPLLRMLAAEIAAGRPVALATTLSTCPDWHLATADTPQPWHRLDYENPAGENRAGHRSAESRPRTFVHTFARAPRLILVGANDFVRALSVTGNQLGYRVTVVDARAVFATPTRFPVADEVIVDWPHRYLRTEIERGATDHNTAVCVMTHDAKFDVPALAVALDAGRAIGFVGALGSRHTVGDRAARLREAGVPMASIARLHSPLGLDLGGHTPAETAISIAAQLIAERHGASGLPLSAGRGPIHR
ncbi:MAG: XdhC family protein [Gordonia sp. (in: high G+C Gram-positive bacteria)]